jgi:hypothetical protein
MTFTRRQALIGTAAMVAAAALPAGSVAPSANVYSALDIEAMYFPDTPAFVEAARSAWLGSGGKLTAFAEMLPHLQALLDEEILTGIDAGQVQTDRPYMLAYIPEFE